MRGQGADEGNGVLTGRASPLPGGPSLCVPILETRTKHLTLKISARREENEMATGLAGVLATHPGSTTRRSWGYSSRLTGVQEDSGRLLVFLIFLQDRINGPELHGLFRMQTACRRCQVRPSPPLSW